MGWFGKALINFPLFSCAFLRMSFVGSSQLSFGVRTIYFSWLVKGKNQNVIRYFSPNKGTKAFQMAGTGTRYW